TPPMPDHIPTVDELRAIGTSLKLFVETTDPKVLREVVEGVIYGESWATHLNKYICWLVVDLEANLSEGSFNLPHGVQFVGWSPCERRRDWATRGGGRLAAEMGDTLGLTHCLAPTMG